MTATDLQEWFSGEVLDGEQSDESEDLEING